MAKSSIPLTQERLKQLVHYDPESGIFTWLTSRSGARSDGIAGYLQDSGYWRIKIDGGQYLRSHLAWLFMTGAFPLKKIDHRDLNRSDDVWTNLREATRQQNGYNRNKTRINTSGFKGVSWHKRDQQWIAQIMINKHNHHLGGFNSAEEASAAYCEAAIKFHGEFVRI